MLAVGRPGQGVPAQCPDDRAVRLPLLSHPTLSTIRRGSEADWHLIDAFHRGCCPESLLRRWGRSRITRRDISRLLAHSTIWIGLDADGAPLGIVSAGFVSREAGVVDLGLQVADAHQRRGIGTLLARHAADHARRRGAHTLTAYLHAANTPMLRLLDRLGPAAHTRHGTYLDVRILLGERPTTGRRP
ncbi:MULTISPECIES: GNAT family N-acetyltransferase [Streptomyces]|uniref:GNAT family N-acetyltransferase n=1 Tax=Streptomyces TaxID=1883 RepID=UPI00277D0968|nr:GNAT family N-acetyltransferase [Streptomyces sp. NRRL B-24085]